MNFAMFLGMLTGLAVGLVVICLLFRKKILDCTFDERQQHIRGRAFKYGFFTLMLSVILYGFSELFVQPWCDTIVGIMICVCISLTVFAVTCIVNDAYLSLRERPRQIMTVFTLLAAINLLIGITSAVSGTMIEEGLVTFRAINLIVGITLLLILLVYIVNYLCAIKETDG